MKRHATGLIALSLLALPLLAACASTGSPRSDDGGIHTIVRIQNDRATIGPVRARIEDQFGGSDLLGDVEGGETADFTHELRGNEGRYRLTARTPDGSEEFVSDYFDISTNAIIIWRLSSDRVRVQNLPESGETQE